MAIHKIQRGLTLPVGPSPKLPIRGPAPVGQVALLADDYPGLRPRLHVEVGNSVERGDSLFEDRAIPGVRFTAPGKGRVAGIHRGAKRVLQSVVIDLDATELDTAGDTASHRPFQTFRRRESYTREQRVELLAESGLWTSFRTRPFSRVPQLDQRPFAIFVTAIDTQPLAIDPEIVILEDPEAFREGLLAVSTLTEGTTYLCVAPESEIGNVDAPVQIEAFEGPHPAGLAGLHIHMLAPVNRERVAWTIGYQDVMAIGRLFRDGRLDPERVVSIAGPPVSDPRLVRTRMGASLTDLTGDDAFDSEVRLISGSMLSGKAMIKPQFGYLGRYDCQLTVLQENRHRELLGWMAPGRSKFSLLPVFVSKWLRSRLEFSTTTHGARRAMVPIGVYERVMPMDILPTFLLRALLVGDVERAEELGCLELDEEDLSLCSFVCPSKIDYGPILRSNLNRLAGGRD